MKKLFTLAMICFIAASMQAKIIYVTADATSTTIAAPYSWANPVTLTTALTNASSLTTDSIFVKAGTYTISAIYATQPTTMIYLTGKKAIFGGFAGTEGPDVVSANIVNARTRSDKDGNGIVEPWEFDNQTIFDGGGTLMVMYTSGGSSIIDGLVIQNGYAGFVSLGTSTNTFATTSGGSLYAADGAGLHINGASCIVQNCIIRNNKNTTETYVGPTLLSTTVVNNPACAAGLTLKQAATVTGCLVEGNIFDFVVSSGFTSNSIINALASAPVFTNTTGAGVYNGNAAVVKNSVIRNNITKGYKYTLTNSKKSSEPALRGGGAYMNNAGSVFANCIFANNEVIGTDVGLVSNDNVAGGGLFADNGGAAYNCTFVNNKISSPISAVPGTFNDKGYGGGAFFKSASSGTVVVKGYNNAFWNNTSAGTVDPTKANLALRNNFTSMLIDIQNNVLPTAPWWYGNANGTTTKPLTGVNSYANFVNCTVDLAATNGDVKGPGFNSPSAGPGYSSTASDIKATWSINNTSFLLAKGSSVISGYTPTTDFIGANFLNPPAAGAFQISGITTAIQQLQSDDNKAIVLKSNNNIISTVDGVLQVITFNGKVLKNQRVTVGQQIILSSGAYIIKCTSDKGTNVQKVVL
ncbi:MAG: T9SS type A sorting domain-containing protein [Paludibacter sp.]